MTVSGHGSSGWHSCRDKLGKRQGRGIREVGRILSKIPGNDAINELAELRPASSILLQGDPLSQFGNGHPRHRQVFIMSADTLHHPRIGPTAHQLGEDIGIDDELHTKAFPLMGG